jgi:xanthine/uracil/vitamin C permease (AzgA family)
MHGNRSMTWPASLLALLISGSAMIVLLVAGLMTWIIGWQPCELRFALTPGASFLEIFPVTAHRRRSLHR